MLFNDTGLELPETVENVMRVRDHYGLQLVEANAGDKFWEALPVFGSLHKSRITSTLTSSLLTGLKLATTHPQVYSHGLLAIEVKNVISYM